MIMLEIAVITFAVLTLSLALAAQKSPLDERGRAWADEAARMEDRREMDRIVGEWTHDPVYHPPTPSRDTRDLDTRDLKAVIDDLACAERDGRPILGLVMEAARQLHPSSPDAQARWAACMIGLQAAGETGDAGETRTSEDQATLVA